MDDLDHPKETPEQRATRLWGNADLTRRFLEEKRKLPPQPATKVVEVIENKQRLSGSVIRAQTKFAKEIKQMLEGHTHRNLLDYKRAIQARIHRLKREKLKRLMALHAQGTRHKDLFS